MKHLLGKIGDIKFVAVASFAAVAALVLPADMFKDVTQELMAMFGLLMAGILPTMVLTASALRAGNLSVKKIVDYRNALAKQMNVWIGFFVLSLVASVAIVVGKMIGWSFVITPPQLANFDLTLYAFDGVRLVNALISFSGCLLIFRAFSLGKGIVSLLVLNSELAISEANLRDDERNRRVDAEVLNIAPRPGFGEYVDLKH